MFDPQLFPNSVIDNKMLCYIFKCSNSGGMRRSKETNTLVLVCDHTDYLYQDRWHDGILYYTGMGMSGDQKLDGNQNGTLYNTFKNKDDSSNPEVFLFEVYKKGAYTYRGKVELAFEPFQEEQRGENGVYRKVWIFPIKGEGTNPTIPEDFGRKRTGGSDKPM